MPLRSCSLPFWKRSYVSVIAAAPRWSERSETRPRNRAHRDSSSRTRRRSTRSSRRAACASRWASLGGPKRARAAAVANARPSSPSSAPDRPPQVVERRARTHVDALVAQERLELAPARRSRPPRIAGQPGGRGERRPCLPRPRGPTARRARSDARRRTAPLVACNLAPCSGPARVPEARRPTRRLRELASSSARRPPPSRTRTSRCRRTSPGRGSGRTEPSRCPANQTSTQACASWSVTTHFPSSSGAAREADCDASGDPEHAQHQRHRAGVVLAVARFRARDERDERRPRTRAAAARRSGSRRAA